MCLANYNFIFVFDLLLAPPDDVSPNIADLSNYFKNKGEIEINFLNAPSGGLKLNH